MKRIPIDSIEVGTHRRALKDLKALASSIEDVGLLNPITVRVDGKGYRLIAGYHRLTMARTFDIQASRSRASVSFTTAQAHRRSSPGTLRLL